MKKLNVMMEEHEKLKKALEAKGYSGIVQYEQVPLQNRILCRLIQLALAVYFVFLLSSAGLPREIFTDRADARVGILLLIVLFVVWPIAHIVVDWYFRAVVGKSSARVKLLPVSGYLARRKLQAEIEALQTEIAQLDEKSQVLEPILEKFSKAAVIIEDQLGGDTNLVKEVGKNPCFRALLERDAVLAKLIPSKEDALNEEERSCLDLFREKYISLAYDVLREGAYTELLYNVAILLEWKKTKLAEEEIVKKFAEEAKRSS